MCMMQGYSQDYSTDSINDVLEHASLGVPKKIIKYAIEGPFKASRYLFIEKKADSRVGYCTYCNQEYEVANLKHNSKTICEKCGSELTVKQTRYNRKNLIDKACFIYYEKSLQDPEALVASGYYAERNYSGDYKNVKTDFNLMAVYVFKVGEHPKQVVKDYSYYYGARWRKTSSIYSFNTNSLANYEYSISYNSIEKAVKNTPFQYSQWEEYVGSDMLRFFEVYTKYPLIESLTKVGMKSLIKTYISGGSVEGCINWRGKTIYKMLKIGKKDLRDIRESAVFVSPMFMKLYQLQLKEGLNLGPHEVKELERIIPSKYEYEKLEKILNYCTIKKAYKYITKQEKLKMVNSYCSILSTWIDYIKDCKTLKLDLNKENVLFPKNLVIAHQNTIKQIRYKEDKPLNKKINQRIKMLEKKYCYEYGNLLIRPAVSTLELIEEGKALNHCVGGYAKGYAEGKTDILVIRDINKPNDPYFTVEVKDNKLKQVHGLRNCNPEGEVAEFVEAFKEEKLEKKKNEKIKLTA